MHGSSKTCCHSQLPSRLFALSLVGPMTARDPSADSVVGSSGSTLPRFWCSAIAFRAAFRASAMCAGDAHAANVMLLYATAGGGSSIPSRMRAANRRRNAVATVLAVVRLALTAAPSCSIAFVPPPCSEMIIDRADANSSQTQAQHTKPRAR